MLRCKDGPTANTWFTAIHTNIAALLPQTLAHISAYLGASTSASTHPHLKHIGWLAEQVFFTCVLYCTWVTTFKKKTKKPQNNDTHDQMTLSWKTSGEKVFVARFCCLMDELFVLNPLLLCLYWGFTFTFYHPLFLPDVQQHGSLTGQNFHSYPNCFTTHLLGTCKKLPKATVLGEKKYTVTRALVFLGYFCIQTSVNTDPPLRTLYCK